MSNKILLKVLQKLFLTQCVIALRINLQLQDIFFSTTKLVAWPTARSSGDGRHRPLVLLQKEHRNTE